MHFKTSAIIYSVLLSLSIATASCGSSRQTTLPYFNDISAIETGSLDQKPYITQIKPDDELLITATSSYPEAIVNYNLPLSNPTTREELLYTSQARIQTYIVNTEGYIELPIIGSMKVVGLTTEQLQKQLTELIRKDVADATVRVELVNFEIVVAGEVVRPGRQRVNRNRYSILDALSAAGDLTAYGERSNILIIREENGKREYHHLNLNTSDVLTSPYFYLKQNDYIYISPNDVRQANAKYNQDNAFKLQVISTIVSASSVIASLVIALTVK